MEQYIVSARKYRPHTFGSVVGQEALTTTLKNAIQQGRLAHAYLFCGPRGVGKTTCARIFAKTINCLTPTPEGECCESCESCKAFNEQRSYNIHELDAASNNSVDDIRELCDQVLVQPQIGRYKVFIIDEVHMLSSAAFNAFLKTLEEPPAHAIFILATTEKHKILPTILSRCQIYDFNRMEVPEIVAHLRYVASSEGITFDEESLNVIAQKADGGMRDALSIFDQVASFSQGAITYEKVIKNLNVLDHEYYFRLTDHLLEQKIPEVLLLFNDVLSKGFAANHFISGFATHLRDLLVCQDTATLPLLQVAETVRSRYAEQAQRCRPQWLYRVLRLCNNCDLHYRESNNKRLLVELTLIEVAQADDDPSSGRCPTKQLQPLFEATQAQPATASGAPAVAPSTSATTPISPQARVRPSLTSPSSPPPPTKQRKMVSIRQIVGKAPSVEVTTPAETITEEIKERAEFTTDDISREWLRFSNELPDRYNALKSRMRVYRPEVTTCPHAKVIVQGEQVKEHMEEILPELLQFLRRELHNGEVTLDIEVAIPSPEILTKGKREIYQEMLRKNAGMLLLQKELKLEFY